MLGEAQGLKISVVIPAYNAAQTIGDTLASLLAQTYSQWQAVVVDDGSTDATGQVVRSFVERDPRIALVTQPNGGEAAARNRGIAEAHYEWLLFLDSDDWIAPDYLDRMSQELAADPALDAVHCGYARVAADGTAVVEPYRPPTGDLFPTLARRAAFPVHACVVRKSIVEQLGGFDTSLRTSTDWDLWQRLARSGARFGAVSAALAYYRMSPNGVSLDACQLFKDGLRVLRQGHSADPRVRHPHPGHQNGEPPEQVRTQMFYLLSWCAGLLIGSGKDAAPLLEMVEGESFPNLSAEAVAQCIFEAAPLPTCQPPRAWEKLWPELQPRIEPFLVALERQSMAPELAPAATRWLKRMILKAAPNWNLIAEALEEMSAPLEPARGSWQRLAEEREQIIGGQSATVAELEQANARLEKRTSQLEGECDELRRSYERRLGDLLLNRLRLRAPMLALAEISEAVRQRLSVARLAAERRLLDARGQRRRVIATVCDSFPIYSQTFVYQELTQLARHGFDVRLIYSKLDAREYLQPQFGCLWKGKRRLFLHSRLHENDFARYRRRMPEKVESLIQKLCAASGMTRPALLQHSNFLQAFSFTRMVEAYRPQYLHSYFFYDRSLMALVAGYLLDIPRGVSCYADHVLKDYELKVVALHLEICDIVIATSARIKQELLKIAPHADPARILVKPNGIDTGYFPVVDRAEPAAGQPFRLVTVCRIEPKKGLIDLVEAVGLLRQRGLDVEAHILGTVDEWSEASRSYKDKLDRRIGELGLWGRVHLEGRQDLAGIQRFLGMAQLFIAPFVETESGDKDGIPTALLEGMSTGLPAVATDAGSIAEVIEDGQDGVLVSQHDPVALANAIDALLRDAERRRRIGREAANKVRRCYEAEFCERIFHDRIASGIKSCR